MAGRPTSHDGINYIGKRFGKLVILSLVERKRKTGKNRLIPMYLCKCDCGNEKIAKWEFLNNGDTKSCGCLQRETVTKPLGESGFNILFSRYKKGAEKRGLVFELNKDQFREMTQRNCFYCGISPSTVCIQNRMNGAYTYNGIDRIDSSKGYLLNNVVSCCGVCNCMKRHYSLEDFKNYIARIYHYLHLDKQENGI